MAFGHFLLGSHNFMITTLGSCVKWALLYTSISLSLSLSQMSQNSLQPGGFSPIEGLEIACSLKIAF
jgi:hypothetical protein